MYNNFSRASTSKRTKVNIAAGVTTPQDSSAFDADGCVSVVHRVHVGTLTANQTTVVKAQHGDLSDESDMADIPNATYTLLDADSDKLVLLELFKITKRYHRVRITRGVANAEFDSIETIGLFDRKPPTTNGATVAATKVVQG